MIDLRQLPRSARGVALVVVATVLELTPET